MSNSKISPISHNLELDEDLTLFGKGKRVQHIGWVVMVILLLMGILGMFGSGPLSYKTYKGTNASIEFERFLRFEHELHMTIKGKAINGQLLIAFESEYFKKLQIGQINPMPVDFQHKDGYVLYTFKADNAAENTIRFYFSPEGEGSVKGKVIVNKEQFSLKHFIYP